MRKWMQKKFKLWPTIKDAVNAANWWQRKPTMLLENVLPLRAQGYRHKQEHTCVWWGSALRLPRRHEHQHSHGIWRAGGVLAYNFIFGNLRRRFRNKFAGKQMCERAHISTASTINVLRGNGFSPSLDSAENPSLNAAIRGARATVRQAVTPHRLRLRDVFA